MHPKDEKERLRTAIAERLKRLTETDRAAESRSTCRRLLQRLPKEPVTVCAYYPLKSEIDLKPLMLRLLEDKYPLYLPRFEGGKMVFRRVMDLTKDMQNSAYGIPEPGDACPLLDPSTLDIALIPARAYAPDGRRMGRGNGGYDIWIRAQRALNPKTLFWGVCFESQVVPDIPMEAHDEKVDLVFTQRGASDVVS